MTKHKILNYINIFRGIAIIFIVLGHSIDVINPCIKRVLMELFAHGTIFFLFISGFLFQYLSKNFDYKVYLIKKWKNIILPYLIISIPGIIYCLMHNNIFSVYNPFYQIILYIITGIIHNPPTWYIPLIVIYFLVSKLLLSLEKREILYKFLPILAICTLFIQRLQYDNSIFNDMTLFYRYLIPIYVFLLIIISLHFIFIYILGMYFSANKCEIKYLYKNRIWLFCLMILSACIDIYSMKYNMPQNGDISKIFATLLLLSYLKYYDKVIQKFKLVNGIFNKIAKYSFGIFFVHWYILMIFNKIYTNPYAQVNDIVSLLGNMSFMMFKFFTVFIASFILCWFMKITLNKLGIHKTRSFIGI